MKPCKTPCGDLDCLQTCYLNKKGNTMTHYEAVLNHIKADAPCSFKGVMNWANSQGFGGAGFSNAIAEMLFNDEINIIDEGGSVGVIVELVSD